VPTSTTIGLAAAAPALGNASNAQIFWGGLRATVIPTNEAGWSAGTGASGTGPNFGARAEWLTGAFDSTPTMTIASNRWQSMYIEVKVAGAAGPAGDPDKGWVRNRVGGLWTR